MSKWDDAFFVLLGVALVLLALSLLLLSVTMAVGLFHAGI